MLCCTGVAKYGRARRSVIMAVQHMQCMRPARTSTDLSKPCSASLMPGAGVNVTGDVWASGRGVAWRGAARRGVVEARRGPSRSATSCGLCEVSARSLSQRRDATHVALYVGDTLHSGRIILMRVVSGEDVGGRGRGVVRWSVRSTSSNREVVPSESIPCKLTV